MKQLLGLVLFAGLTVGAVAAVTGYAAFEADDEEPYGVVGNRFPPALEEPAPPRLLEANVIRMPEMVITVPKPPPPPVRPPVKMRPCSRWMPLEQGGGRVQRLCP